MSRYRTVDGVEEKRCSTCKNYFPMNYDHFSKRSASSDGLAYSCKACERATAAKSYEGRKRKQKAKERYQENRETIIERSKERYQENKEQILEQQKEWRQTKKGKQVMQEADNRRKERIKEQTPGGRDYTREQVIERDSIFGDCICQICGHSIDISGGELHIDHIVSIAEGGSDTFDNVRSTHKTCNLSRPKDGSDLEAIS